MFPEQLRKIIKLSKKTGDRVIIFDPSSPDDSYVIMDFDRYEREAGGQEGPAAPIAPKEPEKLEIEEIPEKEPLPETHVENSDLTEEDLTDKINREISIWKNRENSPSLAQDRDIAAESRPKKDWGIPPQVKDRAKNVE